MLHLVYSANKQVLETCIEVTSPSDEILFLEAGVSHCYECETNFQCKVYALQADLLARGLDPIDEQIFSIIDDKTFVKLTACHQASKNWF